MKAIGTSPLGWTRLTWAGGSKEIVRLGDVARLVPAPSDSAIGSCGVIVSVEAITPDLSSA